MPMSKWAGAVCCVCGEPFKCSYQGKPYCNKHWLRLYNYGTVESRPRQRTNKYEIKGEILYVTTAKGEIIKADAQDYDVLTKYSWCISKTGYPVANINGKVRKMHRYILNAEDGAIIDHVNGNPLDNRRENLRICKTPADNARNCKVSKNNTSGVTGVSKNKKTGKYRARIMVGRKEIRLGVFESFDDAVKARQEAEARYFGEYAPCVCRKYEKGEESK